MSEHIQLQKDCKILGIDDIVTTKYKRMAKVVHPDKGGNDCDFQELLNAYRRVVRYVENLKNFLNYPKMIQIILP